MKRADDTVSATSSTSTNNNGNNEESFLIMAANTNNSDYVSVHRRHLNRITQDGLQSVRHQVPDRFSRTGPDTKKILHSYKENLHHRSCGEWVETFLPCYKWLQTYQWKSTLPKDIVAGITVGAMIVPQVCLFVVVYSPLQCTHVLTYRHASITHSP